MLKCRNCGGALTHVKFREWKCEYCGNPAIISDENDVVKCILKIEHDGDVYKMEMTNECSIEVRYKRRATMADRHPMVVEITSGDESQTVESVENIGKGIIDLVVDVDKIKVKTEGKIKADYNGMEQNRYLDIGSSIILGSVTITIMNNDEEPKIASGH